MLKSKEKLREKIDEFVKDYDMEDPMINLKYYHTFRVADISEKLAQSLNMTDEQVNVAYIIGLLHDIGRFYQVKNYQTFVDSKEHSVDHGDLGYEMLKSGYIREYIDDDKYDYIIEEAVRNHNKLEIDKSKNYSELELKFLKVIRDADKLDIYNIVCSNDKYINYTDFEDEKLSNRLIESLHSREIAKYQDIHTKLDSVIVTLSYVFDIYYDYSLQDIKEKQYFKKYVDLLNISDKSRNYLYQIIDELNIYINERLDKKR